MRLRLVTLVTAAAAAISLICPAFAVGSLFTVRDVQVEATGESGVKACEQAYAQGHQPAWKKLIERIVPESDWARTPLPPTEQMEEFVAGFQPSGEKRSTSKCIATMNYVFRGDLVKKYLREAGIAYADRRGPATLAIALYDKPDGTRLWGDDNLWLNAFRDVKLENELIPVEAPFGDDGDKAAIPPGTALGTDWFTYKTIADKYGMKGVLVAHATYAGGKVQVKAVMVTEQGSEEIVASGAGDDERGALRDAVRQVGAAMNTNWKEKAAIDNSTSDKIVVWAPYRSLQERNSIEQRLRKIQNILAVTVTRITTSGMSISLGYRGRNDQFAAALKEAGFGIYHRRAPTEGDEGGSRDLILVAYRADEPMAIGAKEGSDVKIEGGEPQPSDEPAPPIEDPQVIRPQ